MGHFVDLILTDPPYNVGKDFGEATDDSRSREEYTRWCAEWFALSQTVCRRAIVFPGHGNWSTWYDPSIRKPSSVGCWYKPGNFASSHLGMEEWEPWLYWGTRVGGSSVIKQSLSITGGTGGHPTPKPIPLMSKLIQKMKATSVLDLFCGSGTTLVAAKALAIHAVGIEIEERWCEVSARRLDQGVLDFNKEAA